MSDDMAICLCVSLCRGIDAYRHRCVRPDDACLTSCATADLQNTMHGSVHAGIPEGVRTYVSARMHA